MPNAASALLDKAVEALPLGSRGPGGAVAVIRDGEVILRHAWGYADLDRRVEMTPQSLMPVCSVTKQFTCGLLLDLFADPSALDGALEDWLPDFEGPRPTAARLAHNQSGLRDYWALTVLHGAFAEGVFTRADARSLIERTRTPHFSPGHRYSYSNGNFHMLGEILAERAGRDLGELLAARILAPAGMETARLSPDTAARPGDVTGYEGNAAVGFFPAVNRIWWAGDAGLVASLDDLIAWERFIDRTRADEDGLYRRLSRPQSFADGRPAHYGFGLAHAERHGVATTGHGGALRGWRCHRVHAASERLSVVVMFNHEANARAAALSVLDAALGHPPQKPAPGKADAAFSGDFLDRETGLSASVRALAGGGLSLRFGTGAEVLDRIGENTARNDQAVLSLDGDGLRMQRPGENLDTRLDRLSGAARPEPEMEGLYRSDELRADFRVTLAGGAPHGGFSGFLGEGPMQPLYPLAPDVWLLPVRRSMDAPAPGEWTVRFSRDDRGRIAGAEIGCWLARHNVYRKVG